MPVPSRVPAVQRVGHFRRIGHPSRGLANQCWSLCTTPRTDSGRPRSSRRRASPGSRGSSTGPSYSLVRDAHAERTSSCQSEAKSKPVRRSKVVPGRNTKRRTRTVNLPAPEISATCVSVRPAQSSTCQDLPRAFQTPPSPPCRHLCRPQCPCP